MYHKTAELGVMIAFAMILSYIESLIPSYFGVPGIKVGLPNFIIVLVLIRKGNMDALLVYGFGLL